MWTLEYSEEVKLYFVDNGDLVFDVLVKIEEMKFIPDAMPAGATALEGELGTFKWPILDHWITFEILRTEVQKIKIWIVKPQQ